MGNQPEGDEGLVCPACSRDVPEGARWCGSCGEALTRPQPIDLEVDTVAVAPVQVPAGGPSPLDAALGVPMVAAALASGDEDDEAEDEGVAGRDRATRQTIRVAVAAVLIAVVGLTSVVSRPARPSLAEAAAIGAGDAGGRDAARTGRLAVESVEAPERVVWSEAVRAPRRNSNLYGRLLGDVVVLQDNDDLRVLDRSDGTLLWTDRGYPAGRLGDSVIVSRSTGATAVRDAQTGEEVWARSPNGNGHVYAVGSEVFEVSFHDGHEWLKRLDPATGGEIWQATFEHSVPYVNDVIGDWALAEEYRSDESDFASHSYTIVQHLIDLRTGDVVRSIEGRPLDDQEWGWHQSVALLGNDSAVVLEQGQATIIDLDGPTSPGRRMPELDGDAVVAGGSIVVVVRERLSTAYDRSTLERLWELPDSNGDLATYEVAVDPANGLLVNHSGVPQTWLDPRTGEVVHSSFGGGGETTADREGAFTTQPEVHYASHDGGVSWTLGGEELPVDGRSASLRVVDDRLITTFGDSWFIHDLSGRRVRSVDPSGAEVASLHRGPVPMLARGEGVLSVANKRVRWAPSARTLDYDWTHQMGAEVTAAVATASTIHAATREILRSLDPVTGDLVEQRGQFGLIGLSAAGDEALFGLADTSKSSCALVDDDGCQVEAVRFDPMTLEPRWTSAPIEGACAAPTVGRDAIAVPTITGATFLSARTGEVTGRWEAPRTLCTEAAHDGHQFLLGTDDGLLVGIDGDDPTLLETFAPISTAPVVAGRHALVGLFSNDLVAIDLDSGEFAWKFLLDGGLLAPPAVHNGTIIVLLSTGDLARLA